MGLESYGSKLFSLGKILDLTPYYSVCGEKFNVIQKIVKIGSWLYLVDETRARKKTTRHTRNLNHSNLFPSFYSKNFNFILFAGVMASIGS